MSTARAATFPLQLGLLAVVLVVLPYKLFELDRYFVPKELALHAVVLVLLGILLVRGRSIRVDAADTLLGLFLAWSILAALFATNYWLAQRALGLSAASALVFWAARHAGANDHARPIVVAAAFAGVLAAGTVLFQAYGYESRYFSLNRAPGGTFGNRNFAAHFTVIALPSLIYSAASARRPIGAMIGAVGIFISGAALVLTRSRAAWLAAAAALLVFAVLMVFARRYWRDTTVKPRLGQITLAAFLGASVAMVLPNNLNWRSDSPYLDSARGMVDYRSGSGRGRVAQYQNSLEMVKANPLFGVGPGNWPVHYPHFAPRNDRSLTDEGTTANPWPSSDWVAMASERGPLAAVALLGVFAALFIGSLRRWRQLAAPDVILKIVLAATVAAAIVVSAFDAALLLAAPALLIWSVVGATGGVGRVGRDVELPRRTWLGVAGLLLLIVSASLARSVTQTIAIDAVGSGGTRAGWMEAARWDPGSYRINQRVAELEAARGRCASARAHARRARALLPHAAAPQRVLRRCG